jgi:hypothetical protein
MESKSASRAVEQSPREGVKVFQNALRMPFPKIEKSTRGDSGSECGQVNNKDWHAFARVACLFDVNRLLYEIVKSALLVQVKRDSARRNETSLISDFRHPYNCPSLRFVPASRQTLAFHRKLSNPFSLLKLSFSISDTQSITFSKLHVYPIARSIMFRLSLPRPYVDGPLILPGNLSTGRS